MPLTGLASILERAADEAVGFGIGTALARGLEPEATLLAQASWKVTPDKAVEAGDAAEIVAEDVARLDWGEGEAAQTGVNAERFGRLVDAALNGPDFGTLLTLWRRDLITDAELLHGLRKARLEARWDEPLQQLRTVPLTPAEVAVAVQRGLLPNRDLLPVAPPTAAGRVPPMPTVDLDPYKTAAAHGAGPNELRVLTRIVGLPPAPGELLQLVNRGAIDETDFFRGIAEGNTRNEWAPFLLGLRRRLLTPHEYVELRIRGWIDDAAMHAGAALTGMTHDDTDLLAKMVGRPLSFHQVFIGERRGGVYDGPTDEIDPAFLKQLQESNIRPEWYHLAWAQRYSLPSAFVVRSLLSDGSITPHEAESIFLQSGWPPDLAAKVAGVGKPGRTAADDPHAKKAQGNLYTAAHRAYVAGGASETEARDALVALAVPADQQPGILALWNRERALRHRTLTPSQVRRAFADHVLTEAQALARLEAQGMSAAEAGLYLRE